MNETDELVANASEADRKGEKDLALLYINEAVELDPNNPQIWVMKMKFDTKVGSWKNSFNGIEVVESAKKAIDVSHNDPAICNDVYTTLLSQAKIILKLCNSVTQSDTDNKMGDYANAASTTAVTYKVQVPDKVIADNATYQSIVIEIVSLYEQFCEAFYNKYELSVEMAELMRDERKKGREAMLKMLKRGLPEGTIIPTTKSDAKTSIKSSEHSSSNYSLLKIAESAIISNNYSEAFDYANKALENDPSNHRAWLLKMKAVDGLGNTDNLLLLEEFKECGMKAIKYSEYDENIEHEVHLLLVYKAVNTLELCIKILQDTTDIIARRKLLQSIQYSTADDKAFEEDSLIVNWTGNVVDTVILFPIHVSKHETEKHDDIKAGLLEMAQKYISYNEARNKRYNIYNRFLSDSYVESCRKNLGYITEKLPQEFKSQINEFEINNNTKENESEKLTPGRTIVVILVVVLIIAGIISVLL